MSDIQDTYEAGLEAALAVLGDLANEKGVIANHSLDGDFDAVQSARFVGEHGGVVDAYISVQRLLNSHLKARVA